jgi:hypothetical protein
MNVPFGTSGSFGSSFTKPGLHLGSTFIFIIASYFD